MSTIRKEDYQAALNAQSACNLSGIVLSFAEIMQRICNEANEQGKGTYWKNLHPICRLFAEQISYLSQETSYFSAYDACEQGSKD